MSVRLPRMVLALLLVGLLAAPAAAQSRRPSKVEPVGPRDYSSRNFVLHTDLTAEEAADLLRRLEMMLSIISRYWGQPNRAPIECFVVKDLSVWPEGYFPAYPAEKLQNREGVTVSAARTLGGRLIQAKSVVYAYADHGTPQHEAVHAYCGQNFGNTGPTWYAEGMAEMGQYWREKDTSVLLPEVVLEYLQTSEPKPLLAIVDNTDQTGDSWENYAWRWALCNMLANNPNYAARFRPLGLNLLLDRDDSFEKTYGLMAREIEFEYRFFLTHLDNGLRADLIAWDWKVKFVPLARGRTVAATVAADHGWQPSRLKVQAGTVYAVASSGDWQLEKDGPELTAAGGDDGRGQLRGVVFDPLTYTLGEPFDASGDTFTAPADGHLYLRCEDAWGELADNTGKLQVRIRPAN